MNSTRVLEPELSPPPIKSPVHLHGKTLLLIFLMVIFGPLGNVLLGKGMKGIGDVTARAPSEGFKVFVQVMTSGLIWLGVSSLLAFFVAYMLVLSWADYSYVQPASSVAYAVVAVLSHFLLHEFISPLRWAGVLILCFGVAVVGHTPPRTTEPN